MIILNSETRLTFCSPGTDYNIVGIYRKFLLEAHLPLTQSVNHLIDFGSLGPILQLCVQIIQDIPRSVVAKIGCPQVVYQVNTKTGIILYRVEKLFNSAEITIKRQTLAKERAVILIFLQAGDMS